MTVSDQNIDWSKRFAQYLVGAPSENGEQRGFCPYHEDPATSKTPSASFNMKKRVFHCMVCDEGVSFRRLFHTLQLADNKDADVIDIKTRTKAVIPSAPLPTEDQIKQWHKDLLNNEKLLAVMTDERGLSTKTLKEFQIGYYNGRYTIPVRDENGELVNVRRYHPKARSSGDKMVSWSPGWGKARLFRPDLLKKYDEEVVLVEGEMDMMVAHQYGIPAIAHTAGALTFKPEWIDYFKGRDVFIAYDEDDSGVKGASKVARMLSATANQIFLISLGTGIKGGDITDYFVKMGQTAGQFRSLMKTARENPFTSQRPKREVPTTGKPITLIESQNLQVGENVTITATISGKRTPPYRAPQRVNISCRQDKGPRCLVCPMMAYGGDMDYESDPDNKDLLNFMDEKQTTMRRNIAELVGAKCTSIDYEVKSEWNLEELLAIESVDDRSETTQTPIDRAVYYVGGYKTPINTKVRFVARQVADPRNARGLLLSWNLEETKTNIDLFEMNDDIRDDLAIFQCDEGETPLEKCTDIAEYLAANVTRIYGRTELHLAYDLVWHSVLSFDFMSKKIDKGWLECLVLGDTRTGKSEVAHNMTNHYNAGILKSCEGMTFAGLVGGVSQPDGKRWMTSWGVIPLNDRRLVILDEMSGMADRNIIELMSSIRSSGKAQITKINNQQETSARTRLIWISNPPGGMKLIGTNGGAIEAMQKLIKNPEDIARFDFVIAASGSDVDSTLINSRHTIESKYAYTQAACEKLVLWAWSRKAADVKFSNGTEAYILDESERLGHRYISDPPLIQVENVRMKVARIAVALAARTFSTDATGTKVIVTKAHVDSAIQFLDQIYKHPALDYTRRSQRIVSDKKHARKHRKECKQWLILGKHDVLPILKAADTDFKARDFTDFSGMDHEMARAVMQSLNEWKMTTRSVRGEGFIRMTEELVSLLRELEDEGY